MRKGKLIDRDIRFGIKKELTLTIFFVLWIFLTLLMPHRIKDYYHLVDWHTIIVLSGLLLITTGLRESGYFNLIAIKLIRKFYRERDLATFLILFSGITSAFLTNDITLFLVVPITLSIQNTLENDISRLVIFEAMAVNAGSSLTPIGNPQNLYLWHKWGISFISFVIRMLPMATIQMSMLVIFIAIVFPDKKLKKISNEIGPGVYNTRLLWISSLFLVLYVLFIELNHEIPMLLIIFAIYTLFFRREVVKQVDWLLLLMFVFIFIDFGVLSTTPSIRKVVVFLSDLNDTRGVYISSAILSQIISNVPASVFMSQLSNRWLAISYGVNVGGNGLIIGSLANIIALRICGANKKLWWEFHKYSVPFLVITLILIAFCL